MFGTLSVPIYAGPTRKPASPASMSTESEASYDCPECGEVIVIPIDLYAGREQEYVEDCPVCCSPILLRVTVDHEGHARVDAQPE